MSARCEPPPELRDVDGWHWLRYNTDNPHIAKRVGRSGVTPSHWDSWIGNLTHYIAPVATPAEVDALRAEVARLSIEREVWFQDARTLRARVETLERACQSALISLENAHPHYPYNDEWVARHNAAIAAARAALSPATEGALDTTPPAS